MVGSSSMISINLIKYELRFHTGNWTKGDIYATSAVQLCDLVATLVLILPTCMVKQIFGLQIYIERTCQIIRWDV